MKKSILIILSVLLWGVAGQVCVAQNANDYNLQRAGECIQNYEIDKALEYVNIHLQENPKSSYGYFLRAVINNGNEKYSYALSDINNAIKYYKKNPDFYEYSLYWWRAAIYKDTEMYDKAVIDYSKAYKLSLKAKDSENVKNILYDRAQLYYTIKDYDKSDEDYKMILEIDESDLASMIGIARNMIKRENYKEAINIINKCEKMDSSYSEIYRFRMQAYDKLGETKLAIKDAFKYIRFAEQAEESLYRDILNKDLNYALILAKQLCSEERDNVNHKLLLITIYEWQEDYRSAIAEYNKIEKEYGAGANIYYYRSIDYIHIADYSRALIDINKYIEKIGTANSIALAIRSACYENLGQYDKAIEDINKQIEELPSYSYFYRARAWQNELLGDTQSALSDYSTAITLEPENHEYYYMRSRLYFLEGKIELSHADANEVLSRDTIVNNLTRRHYALYFLGRNEEAVAWIDSLINTEPSHGAYYEKACLLSLIGDVEGSISALRTSFEMGKREIVHAANDIDLKNIRNHPDFIALIAEYKAKQEVENATLNPIEDEVAVISEVPMKKMYSGVYEVDCSINNLPLKFIFDTGASSVSISSVEAQFMLKNGYLKSEDIKGKEYYSVANGEIHEGTIIRLREIKIGDAVLRNVDASVVHSQQAPLLLGQTVLERFGTITIDNINSKLVIKQ